VVLHDVADRPDRVVEAAAALDAERLGHRDLHAADVAAVPDRLEQHVREAEHEEILDGFLAEVVVDPEDPFFGEDGVQGGVEIDRRLQVTAERLLDHDPAAVVEPDGRKRLGNGREHRRRDGHVVDGDLRPARVEGGGE
jgi:hypothetical protein